MTQKPLFAGLDCYPGQTDLFRTDGQPANSEDWAEDCDVSPESLQLDRANRKTLERQRLLAAKLERLGSS